MWSMMAVRKTTAVPAAQKSHMRTATAETWVMQKLASKKKKEKNWRPVNKQAAKVWKPKPML